MTAKQVLDTLYALQVINSTKIKPHIKPTHGPCCTCQDCGYDHDDCVCEDNEIITAINNLELRECNWINKECPKCRTNFVAKDIHGMFCCFDDCGWSEIKQIAEDVEYLPTSQRD